jgi:hypothetical protein
MKEGLNKGWKRSLQGSFDLLEAFVFLRVTDKAIFVEA